MDRRKTKICLVAPGQTAIYYLLSDLTPQTIGGTDIYLYTITKELLKNKELELAIIVDNNDNLKSKEIPKLDVIKLKPIRINIRIFNILFRYVQLYNTIKHIRADIYLSGGIYSSVAVLYCLFSRAKSIFFIHSDVLVEKKMNAKRLKTFDTKIFSLGGIDNQISIRFSNAIVVQNEYQFKKLKKNFNKVGILIKKPFYINSLKMPLKTNPPVVLWVGAMADVKQPELFIELAKALPNYKFQMIGGPSGDSGLYSKIKNMSNSVPNLEFLGMIPFDRINKYYLNAAVLVNTSLFEAYPPIAFLHAWMNYTPVVSLNDNSEEILSKYDIGIHSRTFDRLVQDTKYLLPNKSVRERIGLNGRKYVEENYDIKKVMQQYFDLFNLLIMR